MSFSLQRPAIAMIELIFAIVVMGIVMMSAPQLLITASQSGYVAIQQEGINEAATQINMILDFPWDENDTNISHTTLLFVSNGDPELNGTNTGTYNRAGTPTNSHRVYITDGGGIADGLFNASTIGFDVNDNNIPDDIDDFNNSTVNLALDGTNAGESDYIEKDTINITRTVDYADDNASYYRPSGGTLDFNLSTTVAPPSTNIKRIQVTLTSASNVNELAKNITLHAFSCNIGTYKLKESP